MCGRFTLHHVGRDVARRFEIPEDLAWEPRYNIAPTQSILVVRMEGEKRLGCLLRWGFVPAWAASIDGPPLINARSETVATKPTFRESLRRRRCLVPADGFFEWKAEGSRKQPVYFTRPEGELFALGAVWDRWEGPDKVVESVALLTTEANAAVCDIHDRMPVILPREMERAWLDPGNQDVGRLEELLRPCPANAILRHLVGSAVSGIRNDGPACIRPLAMVQRSLF